MRISQDNLARCGVKPIRPDHVRLEQGLGAVLALAQETQAEQARFLAAAQVAETAEEEAFFDTVRQHQQQQFNQLLAKKGKTLRRGPKVRAVTAPLARGADVALGACAAATSGARCRCTQRGGHAGHECGRAGGVMQSMAACVIHNALASTGILMTMPWQ